MKTSEIEAAFTKWLHECVGHRGIRNAFEAGIAAQLAAPVDQRIAELERRVEGYRLSSIEQWRRKKEWQARHADLATRYAAIVAQGERQPVQVLPMPNDTVASATEQTWPHGMWQRQPL
jgi:hypothetical protein